MFEKEKKFFPIKTPTACQLKWCWSTIYLKQGQTASCHRCEKIDLNEENFENFHNLPLKIKERELMLDGKWPTIENGGSGHCTFCKNHEDVGELSDRQRQLGVPNLTPKELLLDNHQKQVTPTILELFLNNTCNLKCVYCGPFYSTQWNTELIKHGDISVGNKVISQLEKNNKNDRQQVLFHKTLEWLNKHGQNLKRLHILGGEPFYQQEFKELINFLENKKFKHLELNVVSNLMTNYEIFTNYTDKIKKLLVDKKIGRYDLTASIDNWGEQAEYARSGLKIDQWKKLFEYCVKEKWIYLNFNNTISCLTIKTLPDLLEYICTKRQNRIIHHHGGEVVGSLMEILHPKIFGKRFWEKDFEKVFELMSKDVDQKMLKIMQGVYKSLPDTKPDQKAINDMKNYLDILDKRRGTNWRTVYPYLDI